MKRYFIIALVVVTFIPYALLCLAALTIFGVPLFAIIAISYGWIGVGVFISWLLVALVCQLAQDALERPKTHQQPWWDML